MLVNQEIKGATYRNLISYIFDSCTMCTVTEYHDAYPENTKKRIEIILKEKNYTKEELIKNYSESFLEKIADEFKNNKQIFNEEYIKKYEVPTDILSMKKFQKMQRKRVIQRPIKKIVYKDKIQKWLEKYKSYIIKSEKKYIEFQPKEIIPYQTIYYLKMNQELKKELLSKESLFEWKYPEMIEDISFFKNDQCWLFNVTHEEILDIMCDSKEEYDYLKSIGIEFVDEYDDEKKEENNEIH